MNHEKRPLPHLATSLDPRRAAREFAADRKPAAPALAVLELVLPDRWGDLLGGRWIGTAAIQVYTSFVPGYSHRRTHDLLERFVTWLHAREHIDGLEREVLVAKIDEMRKAHGGR